MERIFVNLDELEDKRRRIKVLAAEVNNLENEFSLIRSNLDWDIRSRDNIDEDLREISRELDNIAKKLRDSSAFLHTARTSYEEAERILAKKASKLNETLALPTKPIEKTNKTIQNAVKTSTKGIPPLEGVLSYNPKEYNPYVKELQIRLNELGYTDGKGNKLEPDGRFGRCTLVAVNKYKEQNQLWNSGIYAGKVGNTTWLHLFENDIKAIIEDIPAKESVIDLPLTPYERMPKTKENLKKLGYGGFTTDREWNPRFSVVVIDFLNGYGLYDKYYAYKDVTEANSQLFDWIEQAAAGKIQPKTNQGIITVKKNLIKIGYTNLLLFDGWSEDYNKALWDFSNKYGCPEGLIQVNLDKEMVYKWIALAAEGKLLSEDYRGLPKATIDNNYGKESKIRDVCEYNTGKYGSLDDIVNALRAQPDHQKDKQVFYVRMYSSKDQCTYLIEYDYKGVKEGDTFEAKVYRETIDKKGKVKKERIDDDFFAGKYRSFGVLKNGEILANIRFLAELRDVEDIIENKNSIVMNIQDADTVSEVKPVSKPASKPETETGSTSGTISNTDYEPYETVKVRCTVEQNKKETMIDVPAYKVNVSSFDDKKEQYRYFPTYLPTVVFPENNLGTLTKAKEVLFGTTNAYTTAFFGEHYVLPTGGRDKFNYNTTNPINKAYPFKSLHEGIDLCRPGTNVPFYSLSEGEVIAVGGSYNKIAIYDQIKNVTFVYLHTKVGSLKVKKGDKVKVGTELGIQGNTGCAAIHVHVEVHAGRDSEIHRSSKNIILDSINPYEQIKYYLDGQKAEDNLVKPGVNPTKQEAMEYITKKANEYAIPVELALTVAWTENKFQHFKADGTSGPNASGDYGLMQVNIQHKKGMTNEEWNKVETDWKANVDYGLKVLNDCYNKAIINGEGDNGPNSYRENLARSAYSLYNSGSAFFRYRMTYEQAKITYANHKVYGKYIDGYYNGPRNIKGYEGYDNRDINFMLNYKNKRWE